MYLVPVISCGNSALSCFCAALLGTAIAASADGLDRVGGADFQYAENLIFARPAGLAGNYTAIAQGVDAVGYNPAGIAKSDYGRTVSGTFRYHFLEIASGNASYAFPGGSGSPWNYAFSAAFLNYGRVDEVDENGVASGRRIMPTSFNPSFSGARPVGKRMRVGISAKGFSEYLGDFEESQLATGWAVDLGMQYQPGSKNLGFGLALLNAGRKETAQFKGGATGMLPAALKAGLFYTPTDLPRARVAVDAELPWYGAVGGGLGAEYAVTPAFTIRAGTRIDASEAGYYYGLVVDREDDEWQGGNALKAATGFTVATEGFGLDYAVQYWNGLSWVHALTLKHHVR